VQIGPRMFLGSAFLGILNLSSFLVADRIVRCVELLARKHLLSEDALVSFALLARSLVEELADLLEEAGAQRGRLLLGPNVALDTRRALLRLLVGRLLSVFASLQLLCLRDERLSHKRNGQHLEQRVVDWPQRQREGLTTQQLVQHRLLSQADAQLLLLLLWKPCVAEGKLCRIEQRLRSLGFGSQWPSNAALKRTLLLP